MQSAAQSLDTCARHLAPDKLLSPLMPAVEEALKSQDNQKVAPAIDTKTIDGIISTVPYGIISTVPNGIISTVPYEQQKIYTQIILFQRIYYLSISLTGLPCHREPFIVLMSMLLLGPLLQELSFLCFFEI